MRVALRRPSARRVAPLLVGAIALWAVVGVLLARELAAWPDTLVSGDQTLGSTVPDVPLLG